MFRSAKTVSPRPASADLPPHLQPMAITSAAPKTDRRVALLGALVVYGGMPLGLLTLERMMPVSTPAPTGCTMKWELPIDVDPPTHGAMGGHSLPAPAPPPPLIQTGQDRSVDTDPLPKTSDDASDALTDPSKAATSNTGHGSREGVVGGTGVHPIPPGVIPGVGTDPRGNDQVQVLSIGASGLQILRQVDPQYPSMARAAHIQGNVVLRMLVDEQGVPIKVDVVEGPAILQGEAVRAATQWRFVAARVGDQTMKATFLLTLKFKLT